MDLRTFSTSVGFSNIDNATDQDWFSTYQAMDPNVKLWITRREFEEYSYLPPTRYMSVFQRMGNTKGVIIVNLDIDAFESAMDTCTSVNKEFLYVLDGQNQILSTNTYGRVLSDTFQQYLSGTDSLTKKNNSWLKIGHKRYLLELRSSEVYDITYCALIPLDRIVTQQSIPLFVLLGAILCNCLITLLLAYITTKRNFQKIDDIIQTFYNAEKGLLPEKKSRGVPDEYDVILDNVIQVFLKSTYLQRQLAEKQYKQEIAEKAALQLQINPHFLFNTLQTLDFKALELSRKPGSLNRMIQNLSDILKYSLEDPGKFVTLRDELIYLKKYIEIQKERYGSQLIIYFEVDDNLNDMLIPRLILQPLVENSISHGIAAQTDSGYIKVRIFRSAKGIRFVIIDSGIGLDREEIRRLYAHINNENSRNIGLTNVNRRLLLQYGPEHILHIQGKKGMGTCISFVLPENK